MTSVEAGFREGYSWCAESQQCIPPGVKCAVMWGVGCGKSSFFCWRGNVCLPKSLPCNGKSLSDKLPVSEDILGFCTKHYRLSVSSSCQFDPELVIPQPRTEVRRTSGTLAPILTISLLLLGTAVGLVIRSGLAGHSVRHYQHSVFRKYRDVIIKNLCSLDTRNPDPGHTPSMSDLEMMEARDPFMTKCDNVKTFSVAERDNFIRK